MIWIIVLSVLNVIWIALVAYYMVSAKKDREYIAELEALVDDATNKYEKSVDDIAFISDRYSESLAKHVSAFEELNSRCKKLEAELEEKDMKIAKLEGQIESFQNYDKIKTLLGEDTEYNFTMQLNPLPEGFEAVMNPKKED